MGRLGRQFWNLFYLLFIPGEFLYLPSFLSCCPEEKLIGLYKGEKRP
jgi:hypothetical protein